MAARIGENVHECKVRIIRARTNGKICLRTFSLFGSSSFLSLTLCRIEYRNKKESSSCHTFTSNEESVASAEEEEELSSVFLKHPSLAFLFGKSFSRGFLTLGFIWGLPRWTNFQRGGNCGACGDRGGRQHHRTRNHSFYQTLRPGKQGRRKGGGGEKCVRFLPAAKSTTRLRLGSVSLSPPPPPSSLLSSAPLGRKDRDGGEEALQLPAPIATAAAFFSACSCLFFPRIVLGVSVSHE